MGIDDDARQPGSAASSIPSFEVEPPRRSAACHQPPLEAVGEAGDDALHGRELLVEIARSRVQLVGVAQIVGPDPSPPSWAVGAIL